MLLGQARTAANRRAHDRAAAFAAAPVLLIAASEPFALQPKVRAPALVDLADTVAAMVAGRTAGAAAAGLPLVATAVTAGWSVGTADGGLVNLRGEESDWAAETEHAGAVAALAPATMFGIATGPVAARLRGPGAAPLVATLVAVGAPLTREDGLAGSILADAAALAGAGRFAVLAVLGVVRDAGTVFVIAGLAGITAEAALIVRGGAGAGLRTADLAAGAAIVIVRSGNRANDAGTARLIIDAGRVVRTTGTAATLLLG
jgi:hypothetical protein